MTWDDERAALRETAEWLKGQTKYWRSFTNTHHLMGWLHHQGRCVYCNKHLLQDAETMRHAATTDHLLPKAKYPELDNDLLNTVPACGACNSLKGAFDPNERASAYKRDRDFNVGTGIGLNPEKQRILIDEVVKSCLRTKWDERDSKFEGNLSSWKKALERLEQK